MGKRDDSLRRDTLRDLPAFKSPRGNYCDSEYYAPLSEISGGLVVPSLHVAGQDFDLLLFGQDFPIVVRPRSFYEDAALPYPFNFDDFVEYAIGRGVPTGNLIMVADQDAVDLFQQVTGVTLTNDVPVEGYLYAGVWVDRGITTIDPLPISFVAKVEVTHECPVVYGPPHFDAAVEADDYMPIVLAEDDYTAAMKAAGNIITDAGGIWKIVGLWAEEAPE